MAAPDLVRLVPNCRITVDGQALQPSDDGRLTRVTVDLDVDLFGQCEIVFHDPKLELINGTRFASGTAIKVEIGFAQKLHKVFEGEVVALAPCFQRDVPPSLRVVCQESLHRLALSPMTRALNDADDKEIATKIAQEHGLSVEAPSGTKGHLLQNNMTDAMFLRRLAQKHGDHLRLEGKKLIIGPPPKGAQIQLGPDSGIQKARVKLKSLSQIGELTVHGWDPKAKQEIVGKAKPDGDAKKYGKGTLSFSGHEHPPADTATAEKMAKGRLRKIAEGVATFEAKVIGDPRIVPGASLELDKLGARIDGTYRVEKATHLFSKHGYWISVKAIRTSTKTSARQAAQQAAEKAAQSARQAQQQEKQPQPAPSTQGPQEIFARLLDDATSEPLASLAFEVLAPSGEVLFSGTTGADGTLRADVPKSGGYQIRLASAEEEQVLSARLVDDDSGEPLGGVSYEVVDDSGKVVASGTTGDDGGVRQPVPKKGEYQIRLPRQ